MAHLPILLLIVPIAILFLGVVADPEETHAVWYGMLNTLGIFEFPALTDIERFTYAEKRHYFWFGEVGMAAILAGVFAVPLGIFMAGRTEISPAFIGAAVLFLQLFCTPAKADPAGDEGGYRCRDGGVLEEWAGQESIPDFVHCDERVPAHGSSLVAAAPGSVKQTVVPFPPPSDSAHILPPCAPVIRFTVERPMPVPGTSGPGLLPETLSTCDRKKKLWHPDVITFK